MKWDEALPRATTVGLCVMLVARTTMTSRKVRSTTLPMAMLMAIRRRKRG